MLELVIGRDSDGLVVQFIEDGEDEAIEDVEVLIRQPLTLRADAEETQKLLDALDNFLDEARISAYTLAVAQAAVLMVIQASDEVIARLRTLP